MAEDASNDITYFVQIKKEHKSDLTGIRLWNNLKVAFGEDDIWIKGLDYAQVNSLEVKTIPYKSIFYSLQGKLFPLNSRLPQANVPSLLWTPIERAFPIELPAFNHNYFGVNQRISMKLIPIETEMETVAVITSIDVLKQYIQTGPAIRLQQITWAVLNNNQILLMGKPLLPLTGSSYWQRNNFLLPAGFDFELFSLSDALNNTVNEDNQYLIIWNIDNTYVLIEKNDLQPLSLSSFRITMQQFIAHT